MRHQPAVMAAGLLLACSLGHSSPLSPPGRAAPAGAGAPLPSADTCSELCRAVRRPEGGPVGAAGWLCRLCLTRRAPSVQQRRLAARDWQLPETGSGLDRSGVAAICAGMEHSCGHPLCPCPGQDASPPPPPLASSTPPPARTSSAPPPLQVSSTPAPSTTKQPAPTPNYDDMCTKLCNAGEGGSFCNCLKPPASFRHLLKSASLQHQCETLCGLNPRTSLCNCSGPEVRPRPAAVAVASASQALAKVTSTGTSQTESATQGALTAGSAASQLARKEDWRRGKSPGAVVADPDWDAICFELCIVGEGGLLCHCDLPPFLLQS